MRNLLWFYYQIRCDEIKEENEKYYIRTENNYYVLQELIMPIDTLKEILEILYFNRIPTWLLVINKQGELTTEYNKKNYVLLKKEALNTRNPVDLTFVGVRDGSNNIGEIWSKKIDYYMLQINEFGIHKELLINSFNYYVGMAENAISIANRINGENIDFKYVIQHRRIKASYDVEEYYDPTTMVIDLRIRDLSEYAKNKFFFDNISIVEIDKNVQKYNLTEQEVNMLYARLFFPTYYFDLFEDMIIDEEDEEKILQILKKREAYERFLFDFYEFYKTKYNIFEIEWIRK